MDRPSFRKAHLQCAMALAGLMLIISATVLPARIERYEPSLLDTLCLAGEVGWAQRTGVVLFLREHAGAWLGEAGAQLSDAAQQRFERLRATGDEHGIGGFGNVAARVDEGAVQVEHDEAKHENLRI